MGIRPAATIPCFEGPAARRLVLALSAAILLASGPRDAAACACCAEPGARYEGRVETDSSARHELAQIAFSTTAWLYTTEAFPDGTKGLAEPQTERYRAAWSAGNGAWRLALESKSGKRGTLSFMQAKHIVKREMHIPPSAAGSIPTKEEDSVYDEQRSVSLYREWHLVAPVSGEGPLFAGIGKGTTAKLILHGHGNSCASSSDLYFWTLIVTGPSARFTLMGRIVQQR